MNYNTTQEKLILPDYGRNVQNMVEYAMTIEDKAQRQQCAETIIRIMASKVPQQKDSEEQIKMLWDHLALISNYKLDVDSPFPINIQINKQQEHPHLDYPKACPRFRHYGHTLEEMIKALTDIPAGPEKQLTIELVVAQMAKSLYTWNRNVLTAEKIANDIEKITNGKIILDIPAQRMTAIMSQATSHSKSNSGSSKKKKK